MLLAIAAMILLCGVLSLLLVKLLPGTDPVTMLISMAPLYGLFEFSLLLARAFGRPPGEEADEEREPVPPGAGGAPA